MTDYIEWSKASLENLKPKARLYRYEETSCYVARIGMVGDWAVYKGEIDSTLYQVADYGIKIDEESAAELFPICTGLTYRLP